MTLYKPYLAHYGVLGMKWGVRHDRKRSGSAKKRTSSASKSKAIEQQKEDELRPPTRAQKRRIIKNAKLYKKAVNEFNAMADEAFRNKAKPGTVITSKTGTSIEVTESGVKWLKGNKKLANMPIDELMNAIYYLDYKEFPYV